MTSPDRPQLERFQYWQGQTLRSDDLNDQFALDAQRRWWHNRSLHNAFGIVFGLDLAEVPKGDDGKSRVKVSKDKHRRLCVTVQPGLAYDCRGRELWMSKKEGEGVPLPEVSRPAEMTLLIQYPQSRAVFGDWHLEKSVGLVKPGFLWKQTHQIEIEDGVPIASGRVKVGRDGSGTWFEKDESFQSVPSRPLARPRIHSGLTIRGKTAWREFSIVEGLSAPGLEVTIDTSPAGFTRIPCYFAWLQSSRIKLGEVPLPFIYERITDATRTGFNYSLINMCPPIEDKQELEKETTRTFLAKALAGALQRDLLALARRHELYVCWLGIEEHQEPETDRTRC